MWAVLAVIVFLAAQVFLLRNLMKVDSFFARQEEPEETEVLSLAFSDPDTAEKLTAMQCLPDSLAGKKYYRPTEQGSEARVKERLRQIEAWKAERRKK